MVDICVSLSRTAISTRVEMHSGAWVVKRPPASPHMPRCSSPGSLPHTPGQAPGLNPVLNWLWFLLVLYLNCFFKSCTLTTHWFFYAWVIHHICQRDICSAVAGSPKPAALATRHFLPFHVYQASPCTHKISRNALNAPDLLKARPALRRDLPEF